MKNEVGIRVLKDLLVEDKMVFVDGVLNNNLFLSLFPKELQKLCLSQHRGLRGVCCVFTFVLVPHIILNVLIGLSICNEIYMFDFLLVSLEFFRAHQRDALLISIHLFRNNLWNRKIATRCTLRSNLFSNRRSSALVIKTEKFVVSAAIYVASLTHE